jgi:hypothetical protein
LRQGLNIKRLSHSEDAPCRSLDIAGKRDLTKLVRPVIRATVGSSVAVVEYFSQGVWGCESAATLSEVEGSTDEGRSKDSDPSKAAPFSELAWN